MARARLSVVISAGLVALTVAAYGPLWRNDFINLDDEFYVTNNSEVLHGLTPHDIEWAWTTFHTGNWIPLTWMSLQLDASLFSTRLLGGKTAPWAPGFHAQNLMWHTAAVVVLFLGLTRMTGALWRSALVAALFAVHPLHVESVAWASERKDVLSTFFGALVLLTYARYAASPSPGRYAVVVVSFVLGLLAKPMLVTLPFVLMLLDWWPLRRWGWRESQVPPDRAQGRTAPKKQVKRMVQTAPAVGRQPQAFAPASLGQLVREKLPLLVLALLGSIIAATAQQHVGAVMPLSRLSLIPRLTNAVISCGWYLQKTVWPTDLAVYYPHPENNWHWGPLIASAVVLLSVTVAAVWGARWLPWLIVGWLWFLGTILPVLGLIQVGGQGRADRYTYVPHIGLFIAVVWGAAALTRRLSVPVAVSFAGAAAWVAALAVGTWIQVGWWKDTPTIWRHALAVTEGNYRGHANLGRLLLLEGRQTPDAEKAMALLEEACTHYERAVLLQPNLPGDRYDLGSALLMVGRIGEAEDQFREAVRLDGTNAEAWHSLGATLLRQGRPEDAVQAFQSALALTPGQADTRALLGLAFWQLGRHQEAEREWEKTLRSAPNSAEALAGWGLVQLRRGQPAEAIPLLTEALRMNPGLTWAWSACGIALERQGDWPAAVAHHQRAVQIEESRAQLLGASVSAERALFHRRLAHALHEVGRLDDSVQEYRAALDLDPAWPKRAVEEAWRLATDPRSEDRDPATARELASQACEASADPSAEALERPRCRFGCRRPLRSGRRDCPPGACPRRHPHSSRRSLVV